VTARMWSCRILAALAWVLTGCGWEADDERVTCRAEIPEDTSGIFGDCESALQLAVRTSAGLVLTQEEIDWHLDLYQRGYDALRGTLGRPPAAMNWYEGMDVWTERADVVAAWSQGMVETGVPELDDILRATYVRKVVTHFGGSYFTFESSRVVVTKNVAPLLATIPGLDISDPYVRLPDYQQDVVIEPPQDASQLAAIVYSIGWGDCFVACSGHHHWRVGVTADAASLLDDWGDPIPADVLEYWQQPPVRR